MIKITKQEIKRLLKRDEYLSRLEGCGLDNWGGCSEVDNMDIFEDTTDDYEAYVDSEEIEVVD